MGSRTATASAPAPQQASSLEASQLRLSPRDFERLARFVTETCGIRMPPSKRTMLESRLRKHVLSLGLDSFEAYCDLMLSRGGASGERVTLVDAVTTNKTDFFREPHHFDHLVSEAIPALALRGGAGTARPLRVWSAGCSTGEEPYTLAIVLEEEAARRGNFRYSILGTDVSSRVLRHAQDAVYREELVAPVPPALRSRYLLRSRDSSRGLVRIAPELRQRVTFEWLNFMDASWSLKQPFHVIFCRNVFIYFDLPTQELLVNRFAEHLVPGGYLFLGHSETLNGMRVPFVSAAPTVYRRTG